MTKQLTIRSALVLALTLAGCSTTTPPVGDAGPGDGGLPDHCFQDYDCPVPEQRLFFCDSGPNGSNTCLPACINPEDCSAARRGVWALDFCSTENGGLGCRCDEGTCRPSLCSTDSECGAQVCRNGACTAAPAASSVVRCTVTPDLAVLRLGDTAHFTVAAYDATGAPVVLPGGATWTAVPGGPLARSGSGAGADFTAQRATADSGVPAAAVQATLGAVTCQAAAIVVPAAVPPGEVWAVVVDELSGRPVPGVEVALSTDDGAVAAVATTDGRGLAVLAPGAIPAAYSVTAFSPDHDYLTVARYQGASRLLSLVTRRHAVDSYGGYAGHYTGAPADAGLVRLGFAGASLPGSITGLSVATLLGPPVPTDLDVLGVHQAGVPIPAGVTVGALGPGASPIKPRYGALGLAGTCLLDGGAPDERRIAAGACGTRSAWSFAGDLPFNELITLVGPLTGGTGASAGLVSLLGPLIPSFKRFRSSVARDVEFALRPTPRDDAGLPSFVDQSAFTPADLASGQVALAFKFAARMPDLPRYRGTFADGVVVIGGADVPGRGVVPLGLGAGVNSDHDARTDLQDPFTVPGLVQVNMAPAHHGLEGSPYVLLATAVTAGSATDASAASGASALLARLPGNALVFDPDGGTRPVDFSTRAFPALPDGARFNFLDQADDGGVPPRSFRFQGAGPDLSGAALVRVTFTDDQDHRWEVVMDAAQASAGFRLPRPPSTADRLFAHGLASGARSSLVVQTQRLERVPGTDAGVLGFDDVVELGPTNADRTTQLLTAFAFLAYGRPAIQFTTPSTTPAIVTRGSKLVLQVTGFKLGTAAPAEGQLRLGFTPATGCPGAVLLPETTPGNGVLEYVLPAGCLGAETVTAELVATDGTTLEQPGVSKSLQLTIQ